MGLTQPVCEHCHGQGVVAWLRPGGRPTTSPCPECTAEVASPSLTIVPLRPEAVTDVWVTVRPRRPR
jgi:hypothetical protein